MEREVPETIGQQVPEIEFSELSDSDLLEYVEENIYEELVKSILWKM